MSRPLSATVYGKYDMPSLRLYERIAQGLISACRKHVVAATRPSPFKVGDNQRPERTGSGVRKPPPESSVPGENLDRRCLARFLTSLALPRTPKSANGPRSNSFRPDSPLTTTSKPGTEDSVSPSPHRTWSVPDASSQPQLNLYCSNGINTLFFTGSVISSLALAAWSASSQKTSWEITRVLPLLSFFA